MRVDYHTHGLATRLESPYGPEQWRPMYSLNLNNYSTDRHVRAYIRSKYRTVRQDLDATPGVARAVAVASVTRLFAGVTLETRLVER